MDDLQADVATFAANLGLVSSAQNGFDDADFRKKGPLKRKQKSPAEKVRTDKPSANADGKNAKFANRKDWSLGKNNDRNAGKKKHGDDRNAGKQSQHEQQKSVFETEVKLPNVSPEKAGKFGKEIVRIFSRWSGSGEKWYEASDDVASKLEFIKAGQVSGNDIIRSKREQAEALLKLIALDFEKSRAGNSDMKMILSARRSGTSADKVAAMTVLIQENPVANLHTLDSLVGMVASKGGKRHAVAGIDVLKELFITSLLPDRKLKSFGSEPLAALPDTKEGVTLLLWWFWEDCIKDRYEKFVNAIIEGSKDVLVHLKLKSIKNLYELLNAKPEQEKKLLTAIVNKLGDPEKKAASNAAHFLISLLIEHPSMKKVVLREVENFVFRPNLGMRAIYYASVFMNRLHLSHNDDGPTTAKQLVDIYFGLFKAITSNGNKKKSEDRRSRKHEDTNEDNSAGETSALDSRLLSSLLTGVNKAFGFVTEDQADAIIEEHTPALFLLVHSSNFNVGVQALLLVHQILSKHLTVSDRFYRALYSVMLSRSAARSSKIEMFLALVFRVLKSDVSSTRTCAIVKRLMQVVVHEAPQLGCALLLMLSEILKVKPLLWSYILQPASIDDDTEHFKDIDLPEAEDLRVEPRKVKGESDIQVNTELAQELGDDDSDKDDDMVKQEDKIENKTSTASTNSAEDNGDQYKGYNPRHRDPLYSKADQTCWWELTVFASHIHPSVSTMAKTLLSNASVVYSGDPLHDLSLSAFLDRFAEKKPKMRTSTSSSGDSSKKDLSKALTAAELASLAEDDVAPADLIFHRFYCSKAASGNMGKKRKKSDDDDHEIENDLIGSDDERGKEEDGDGDEFDDDEDTNALMAAEEPDDESIGDEEQEEDQDAEQSEEEIVRGDEDQDFEQSEEEIVRDDKDEFETAEGDDDSENEEIDRLIDEEMAMEFSDMSDDDSEGQSGDEGFELLEDQPKSSKRRNKSFDDVDEEIKPSATKTSKKKQKTHKQKTKSSDDDVDEEPKPSATKKKKKSSKRAAAAAADEPAPGKKQKRRKDAQYETVSRKKNASPFVSAEEYSHLTD